MTGWMAVAFLVFTIGAPIYIGVFTVFNGQARQQALSEPSLAIVFVTAYVAYYVPLFLNALHLTTYLWIVVMIVLTSRWTRAR